MFKFIKLDRKKLVLLLPLVLTVAIIVLFYPGFMSYDTIHALRSARNGVTDSMWPPMVSYVWRLIDQISTNPSAMHFFQVGLLLYSVFYIAYIFTKRIYLAAIFLVLYLTVPVVLGTIAVIWKDVLMTSFFLSAFWILYQSQLVRGWSRVSFYFTVALFLIFLGTSTRHNAITGAVPLIFYASFLLASLFRKSKAAVCITTFVIATILTTSMYNSKIFLDNYSLPKIEALPSSTEAFLQMVRVLDIAGASICVGESLFDVTSPGLTLDEIKATYDPKHVNLSQALLAKVATGPQLNAVWRSVAIQHPVCFLHNKLMLTRFLTGAHEGVQFIITHPSVDQNEYGYKLDDSKIRETAVNYIVKASPVFFFKPWFIYLFSLICFVYLAAKKRLSPGLVALYFSGVFYFGSLVIFGNAADARLLFYSTTTTLLFVAISLVEIKKIR